jgi:hypothetical protein
LPDVNAVQAALRSALVCVCAATKVDPVDINLLIYRDQVIARYGFEIY